MWKETQDLLAINPSGTSQLSKRTFVITQRFTWRKESPAFFAWELAYFPVLGNLVSKAIVLTRKSLGAPFGARKGNLGLRLMSLHMHPKCVLTCKPTRTTSQKAWKPSSMIWGTRTSLQIGGRRSACRRESRGSDVFLHVRYGRRRARWTWRVQALQVGVMRLFEGTL